MAGGTSVVYKNVGSLFNPTLAGQKTKVDENVQMTAEWYLYDDVIQLLLAVKHKHPEFSEATLRCLWLPASSVNAERFFSKFNLTVTDRRMRMTENTIETCSMLSFNNAHDI
ncbi:hypothetical protein PR048_023835 [Dryococelus australis]|uniref:HAT C-terminal dimerisation domain-containing protein n=1 Tax=Dryococelus australis TaxID=614101 RepID=A0ABQ9GV74_9NEOP|nr:hypothetical protein PR048_023835 [Dryococelus australis]